jgi:hypothetical protein
MGDTSYFARYVSELMRHRLVKECCVVYLKSVADRHESDVPTLRNGLDPIEQ